MFTRNSNPSIDQEQAKRQPTKTLSALQQRLIKGLDLLPDDIPLCLLNGKKAPQGRDWQNRPYTKAEVEHAIAHGIELENSSGKKYHFYPQGYGLMPGRPITVNGEKRYLLIVDQDGTSAKRKIEELSGGDIPETVKTTSGRPDRCHLIFYVTSEYAPYLRTKKIPTGELGEDGKPEHVELLWLGRQAVLPPSVHPLTGSYQYFDCEFFDITKIAYAPDWVIEQMLFDPEPEPISIPAPTYTPISRTNEQWTAIDWALSYLNALNSYRADDYDDWLAVGMALHSIDDSLLTEWDAWSRSSPKYKPGECEKKWKSFSSSGNSSFGKITIGTLGQMAKQDGWRSPFEKSASFSDKKKQSDRVIQNGAVMGDSRINIDDHNLDIIGIAATVATVTEILKTGFPDWMEIHKLETLRVKSELNNKQAFYALVNGIKTQLDEVQPEDEIRLRALIDWHNAELNFHKALPSMADDILHDASILNIDPIGIWQYLFPAVLSLAGKRVNLDVGSHFIPAIAWTALVAESGAGKTRAENLVTSPMKQLQQSARERFQAELEEWEETIANQEKGKGKKPPKPVERKYLFDIATIQAVMKRQSEQGLNGSLWARDELVGMFQSFNQFNKGESEAISCLLASWDGGSNQVDRVNQDDSYFTNTTRLSIAGGLQPGIFQKAFKDPNDPQGLQARFLFATMKPQKPKRVKGFCLLSEKLPFLYEWLDTLPEGKIKLSIEADQYYDKLYEVIGEQAFNTSMPAIRAWMFKLPAQLLRIALGLHLIECYHDRTRPLWTLQKDTLERAVLFAQYYRSTFHIVQTTAADTDDISAILLQIWDKAITRHPEGISTRDAYREIKAIQYRAKDSRRPVGAYTADLFTRLEQMGKGTVIRKGRQIKFVATLALPPLTPDGSACGSAETERSRSFKPESTHLSDRVTDSEMVVKPTVSIVADNKLSPVTVEENTNSITQALSSSEEAIAISEVAHSESAAEEEVAQVGAEKVIAPSPKPIHTYESITEEIDIEMRRLGWDKSTGRDYLEQTYGKRSRQLLTDEEMSDFLNHLKSLPTPELETQQNVDNLVVGRSYLIQRIVGAHLDLRVEWLEAILESVPNPPQQNFWLFRVENGQNVPIHGIEEVRSLPHLP
ncbi:MULTISPECIES: DUF3987 domain-containing protein [unclassified Coleofasciculus]|uniref:DUF3987 domain-containing protein n=1 Tax=unclassified Coleofasciculus TaxID=2692782 RepID=UPI001881A1B9|nr:MULTISPECIES: DUF3987 domain-containing protein [unclassified Coleofasciculus]MBE9128711.1 DUF3987 domain-containing protein [Coleofasciculus sp. LEGE 07081]MBE9149874.1 DUF3987 domain-containing protein [Coleofasciculus sp. LEGE 07092]